MERRGGRKARRARTTPHPRADAQAGVGDDRRGDGPHGRELPRAVEHYEKAVAVLQDALRDASDVRVAEELVVANYNLWLEGVQREEANESLILENE